MRIDRDRRYRGLRAVGLKTNRLDTLIDGVYAIALTLLVLDVKLPDGLSSIAAINLGLAGMLPKYGVYLIAFSSVALSWMCHHYYASLVVRTDFMHVFLNLAALMFIALVPFSAAAMGTYYYDSWAVAAFTLNMVVASLLYALNWHHCVRYLLIENVHRSVLTFTVALIWAFVLTEAVAAGVAFLSPYAGIGVAACIIMLGFVFVAFLEPQIIESRYRATIRTEEQIAPE